MYIAHTHTHTLLYFVQVPTLYHTYITTGVVHDGPGDQFYVDDEGQLTLDWPKPRVFHIPQDANCQAELTQILRSHGRIVLKPIEGNRAEGVMLVSVAASADADSHDMDVTVCRHTSVRPPHYTALVTTRVLEYY